MSQHNSRRVGGANHESLRAHSAGDSIGFMLWHTTLRWQRAIAQTLNQFDLTYSQFGILGTVWWLGRHGEMPYQRQVAEHSGMGEVMTSQLIKTLERKGFVRRQQSQSDVRARCLTLTPEGRSVTEKAVVAVDSAERRFFGEVGDQRELLVTLRALAQRDATGGPDNEIG